MTLTLDLSLDHDAHVVAYRHDRLERLYATIHAEMEAAVADRLAAAAALRERRNNREKTLAQAGVPFEQKDWAR